MDPITKFLNKVSHKFPKGYPDMNDINDRKLLNSLLEITLKEEQADGTTSKEEIIKILKDEDFTPEQLTRILSSVSSIKYKKSIIDYIKSKGKGPAKVADQIYNKMINTGDAAAYAEYLDNMKDYSSIGDSGNFNTQFDIISKDLIDYILRLEPSIGRTATGKGEILLSVMLNDVKDATSGGDIEAAGKEIEVKNKGAVPMGQKAEFSANTMETVYTDIENEINPKLANDISLKGVVRKRPFNRLGIIFDEIAKEQPEALEDYALAIDKSLKRNYPGLDFSSLDVKSHISGNNFDWLKLELNLAKEVVKLYIKTEGFEEVFFLNDNNGNYKKVDTKTLIDQLGKEIKIYFKDGLPRWSYNF